MTLKMKADVLAEVIRRLRSGEYVQGQAVLRRKGDSAGSPDAFCCLGVMCEIAVEAGVVESRDPRVAGNSFGYAAPGEARVSTAYLPPAVIDWAGIESDVQKYPDMGEHFYEERGQWSEESAYSLASMNDDGKTFPEIADWMAENVVPV